MLKDFNYKCTCTESGGPIEYGFIQGNGNAIFIKVGLDGSLYGYENKYLDIANQLNLMYGYTVMVATNPSKGKESIEEGFNLLTQYLKQNGYTAPRIAYMGFSNGAYIGFIEGYKYNFSKYLLINSPLMVNYHKIKSGLKAIEKKVLIVYGEKDPSIKYAQMLQMVLTSNIKLKIILGANHQFKGMSDTFKMLPMEFFKELT